MPSPPSMPRVATAGDIPALVDLINRAYRVEEFFVVGPRTDAVDLRQRMATPGACFLVIGDAPAAAAAAAAAGSAPGAIRAVLFDAFPVFDPRPVAALAEQLVPGRGAELMAAWRTRQFEYTWLRTLAHDHADLWRCTEDAPRLPVELHARDARRGDPQRGLEGIFEHVLSTDRARAFKPDPRAYRLGLDALGLPREQVVFAAFAGWDAAGAKRFGYPTYWVNRLPAPAEELGVAPDGMGQSLAGLVALVTAARRGA